MFKALAVIYGILISRDITWLIFYHHVDLSSHCVSSVLPTANGLANY